MELYNIYGWQSIKIAVGVLTLVFLLLAGSAGASPYELWNKTYGGTSTDYACCVQQTSDGGYILAGETKSYGDGGFDAWIIKTDSNGNQQWNKTFGGKKDDYVFSLKQTSDRGYVLVGTTESYGAGWSDGWLIKIDMLGNMQWNKTFGGSNVDYTGSGQQTLDGGYILAGRTSSYGAESGIWLIKTDTEGNMEWNKTFKGTDDDYVYSVQQTSDGGYILAGKVAMYRIAGVDAWFIKTDAKGNMEWNKKFGLQENKTSGETRNDIAYYVQQTSDGGYIIAGETASYGTGWGDAWLVKVDTNGNQQWNKTFGRGTAKSVQQASDKGYILASSTYSYEAGKWDARLIKTDARGNELWNRTFGGIKNNFGSSFSEVQENQEGGYILAGSSEEDAWLIKVGGESAEAAKAPSASSTKVASGFEVVVLAITILLEAYIIRRKRL